MVLGSLDLDFSRMLFCFSHAFFGWCSPQHHLELPVFVEIEFRDLLSLLVSRDSQAGPEYSAGGVAQTEP
jgi:hypothetical protein